MQMLSHFLHVIAERGIPVLVGSAALSLVASAILEGVRRIQKALGAGNRQGENDRPAHLTSSR